jgi:cytochrome c biogenesis protein CcmG, thiol:disulfide interchange protein DsbE
VHVRQRWGEVLRWVVVGLALAVLARQASTAGCGSSLVAAGQAAPGFRVADAKDGRTWSLESFRGRPVALVFSATWCPTCRSEMPAVARFVAAKPGTAVLMVSDEDPASVARYLADHGLAIPAAGHGGGAWAAYGVRAVPAAVALAADGSVAWSGEGSAAVGRALQEADRATAAGAADGAAGAGKGAKK